jgi:non-ribosomal peptide synthase protein (TIGR01720 family)
VREDTPGDKSLVAYLAPREGFEPDIRELRSALAHSLPSFMVPAAFVILPALPLSANGKIDRAALPAPSRAAAPDREIVAPRTPAETALCQIWAQVLGREKVSIHDNFFELGGDSILCIQVVSRAQQAGLPLSARDVFQHQTVAELAVAAEALAADAAGAGLAEGAEIPLTPSQQDLLADLPALHPARLLDVREAPDLIAPLRLARALHHLAIHHAALRLRFHRDEDGHWHQAGAPADHAEAFLAGVDLSALPEARRRGALESAAGAFRQGRDLAQGPALRALLVATAPGVQKLLLVLHPLVADDATWRILLADLEAALRTAEPALLPVPTSFAQWSARLAEHARSTAAAGELDYWIDASRTLARALPLDRPDGANTTASARTLTVELDAEETRSLRDDVTAAYHSRLDDSLLTALVQAVSGWTGESRLLVDLEGQGRDALFDGVDLARTVGRFAVRFPVLLEVDRKAQNPGDHLKAIKEQLRAVPRGGVGFGLLRYQGEEAQVEKLRAMPTADLVYHPLFEPTDIAGALFAPASESAGSEPGHRRRAHALELAGELADGRLRLTFTYSDTLHGRATVQSLADRVLASLRALIAHGRSGQVGGFTPSDFPEARVSQKELDSLMAQIGKRRPGTVKR